MTRDAAADGHLNLLDDLLRRALAHGADAADAVMIHGQSLEARWRMGKTENIERSEGGDIGLRVMRGRRQAAVATTDLDPAGFDELARRANAMASVSPEDAYCGLAESGLLAPSLAELDLDDHPDADPEQLLDLARSAEEAALAVDGVMQSEGGAASVSRTSLALALRGEGTSFDAAYAASRHGISCAVIARDGEGRKEQDYEFSATRHYEDLDSPEHVGRQAALNTVRRLGPGSMQPGRMPVVYDPRVAGGLIGHLAQALNGAAVARGASFLKDSMGKQVFADGVRIVDDPLIRRGLRSRPVDGEGVAGGKLDLIHDGRVQDWIMDSATARQLGLTTNGRATRGVGGPPSPGPSNLYLAAGDSSPQALMADIDEGFYVTELIGFGVNYVTGDYSRGAAGFRIEGGEIAGPVSEMTVAGNLKDMFRALTPANDLVFRYGSDAPTLRVEGMTVAGA